MTQSRVLSWAFCCAQLFLASMLLGFPIVVEMIPKSERVQVFALDHATRNELELPRGKTEETFAIDTSALAKESDAGSPFLLFDLLARQDGTTLERITLRVPTARKVSRVAVKLILKDPEIGPKTIEDFQRTGLAADSDFLIFFQSRKMYKEILIKSPRHPLIVPAAYWYFAAAYDLASGPQSVVVMDEESLAASEKVLAMAQSDKVVATAFARYSIDRRQWSEMIQKARRLGWKDAKVVEESAKEGDYEGAAALNSHFAEKYSTLSPKQKAAVTREYGINERLLKKNQVYLDQAAKEKQ